MRQVKVQIRKDLQTKGWLTGKPIAMRILTRSSVRRARARDEDTGANKYWEAAGKRITRSASARLTDKATMRNALVNKAHQIAVPGICEIPGTRS